ncbi:MAG: twin-arginine translocase TatA/TatE family subunit [Candidatus Binatia bacterium]|nr:twin-arginine translocase TatA/TatE family subunit [Candidatus Binatia bacterium]
MPEVAVILVVALVVLGPRRLPEMARALGKGLAEFRKVTGEVNKELQGARDLIEKEARQHQRLARDHEREQRLAKPADPAPAAETAQTAQTVAAPEDATTPPAEPMKVATPGKQPTTNPAAADAPDASGGSQSES